MFDLKENESICQGCGKKTDDYTETKFDEDGTPYCRECAIQIQKDTLLELLEQHEDIVQSIFDEIGKLPRFSKECNCIETNHIYNHIFWEDETTPSIIRLCIKCGGYIDF